MGGGEGVKTRLASARASPQPPAPASLAHPSPYLQGSQRPRTHGQGGERIQAVVSVSWEFVSLGGKRGRERDPTQLRGGPSSPTTSL